MSQVNGRIADDQFTSGAETSAEVTDVNDTNQEIVAGVNFESVSQFSNSVDEKELLDALESSEFQVLSSPFVGQWSDLISSTNWNKGKIISEWRQRLIDSEASSTAYSDEAWARTVGGVTSQHVGRLRRVHQRFGESYETYQGLYWSHFLAAMDWVDAEMWLEGAVQSGWSVSKMRSMRWETMGAIEADKPSKSDIISADVDEDFEPLSESDEQRDKSDIVGTTGPLAEGPDFADADDIYGPPVESNRVATDEEAGFDEAADQGEFTSPFSELPELPADMEEALEKFKLAIVRLRTTDWADLPKTDVLRVIAALQAFVNARGE